MKAVHLTLSGGRLRTALILVSAIAVALFAIQANVLRAGTPAVQSQEQIGPKVLVIPVEGMICISCAATIKSALKRMEGVFHVAVSLENRTARVTYMPSKLSPERIVAVINELGYKAGEPQEAQ